MKLRLLLLGFLAFSATLSAQQFGDRDMTFDGTNDGAYGYGFNGSLNTAIEQPDGKIICGGNFHYYNEKPCSISILRIDADGALDETFNAGTGFKNGMAAGEVKRLQLLSNGKVLVYGNFNKYNETAVNNVVVLNSNGSLDTTFNIGTAATNISGAMVLQDGKIMIFGNFTTFNSIARQRMIRLNQDGTADMTFNIGTGTTNGSVNEVLLQPDGKMVLLGSFTTLNGVSKNRLARINSDGSIDSTFSSGTGPSTFVSIGALQNDGKILIAGNFNTYNSLPSKNLARLNSDGSLDASFSLANTTLGVSSVKTDLNNKILVMGSFTIFNGVAKQRIARLNDDASFDNSFSPVSGPGFNVNNALFLSDGKILFLGGFNHYDNYYSKSIIRTTYEGVVDTSFNPAKGLSAQPEKVMELPDGKILAVGMFSRYNDKKRFSVVKLNSDGTLDETFDTSVYIPGSDTDGYTFKDFVAQPDGKIVLTGSSYFNYGASNGIMRLNANGTIDASFNSGGTGLSGSGSCIKMFPDGKMLVGGSFTTYNGISKQGIIKLNNDGSVDTSFTFPNSIVEPQVNDIAIQPDGKIIIEGILKNSPTENPNQKVMRLNADGTIDSGFTTVFAKTNGLTHRVLLLPNGKILFYGSLDAVNGNPSMSYVLLNSDGSVDNTFIYPDGIDPINNWVSHMALLPDGKILAGITAAFDGVYQSKLISLNEDGSLNATYSTGNNSIFNLTSLHIQQDGKILLGGTINQYKGVGVRNLFRIHAFDLPVINPGAIAEGPYCAGSNISLPYSVSGNLEENTIITAQLSDASGSFATPTSLGTAIGNAGVINGNIPFDVSSGTSYRIRFVSNTPNTISNDNGFDITINTTPTPTATAQSFCSGATVAELDAEGQNLTWYASVDGQPLDEGTLLTTGTYYVSQNIAGCASNLTSVAVTINELSAPTGDAIQEVGTGSTLADLEVEGENIIWYGSEDDAGNAENPLNETTIVEDQATYYATQTIGQCTSEPLAITVAVVLGSDSFNKAAITCYPNPVTTFLNIQSGETLKGISVYNLPGQEVLQKDLNEQQANIDLSGLAEGSYLIQLTTENGNRKTLKIIKI